LLNYAAGSLRQLELSIAEVQGVRTRISGQVALGMMPSTTGIPSRRIAERTATDLPDVSLRIAEGYVRHLTEWLCRGEIDVLLGYAPALSREITATDHYRRRCC
jgi:DNA-binding transcriptional LysR family regulator